MSDIEQEEQPAVNSSEQTGGRRYQLHQKMVSIGDDYWIEDEQGERVYKVDGKVMTWRKTFIFEDTHGNKLAKIEKAVLALKETMQVTAPGGEPLAVVTKDLFTPLKEHMLVKVENGPDLEIHGSLLDHEYTIGDGQNKVAQVSKKWLNIRDSYSVAIEPAQEDVIILAVVVCLDEMTHDGT